jgi:hypothetical protein
VTGAAAGRPPAVAAYGGWPSPISAELVAHRAVAYDAVQAAGAVYWLETRPSEGGRSALVRWTPQDGAVDAVPATFDVGSQVHEYGGGAYLAADRTLLVVRRDDQRIYRMDLDRDRPLQPITPPAADAGRAAPRRPARHSRAAAAGMRPGRPAGVGGGSQRAGRAAHRRVLPAVGAGWPG